MSINNIAATASARSDSSNVVAPSAAASATVDYNQFLQLLVAELQNQDPTSPTDPTQYMSQLASFSAVEQQVQTNSTLDSLLAAQAGGLVGKTVTSADGATSGVVTSIKLASGGSATATLQNGKNVTLGSGVIIGFMNEADALELIRAAIWTIIVASGPAVVAAMIVGIAIALLQALTQVQEMTLTFVPKIVVIFLALTIGAPFIGGQVYAFAELVYGRIEKGF